MQEILNRLQSYGLVQVPPAIKIIYISFSLAHCFSVMIVNVSLAALAHLSTSFCLKGLTVLTP